MKWFSKGMAAILLAGCICLGIQGEVRAEKKESPELAKLLGFDACYDCGNKTEDGVWEFKSDTHSLKEGDIVELQLIYNADKDTVTGGLDEWDFYVTHDTDVLEYLGVDMKEEYKIKYVPKFFDTTYEEGTGNISGFFTHKVDGGFKENDCLFIVRYKVKKAAKSTPLYIDSLGYSSNTVNRVTLYESEGATITCSDVFTVTIEDNTPQPSLALSSAPAQGNGEITVPISIEKNDGFNLLGLELNYDTSLFTYSSLELADSLKSKISLDSIYEAPGSGSIKASFIALEDVLDTGNFLELKLKVKDSVPTGTTSSVTAEISQVGNKSETDMIGTGTACTVSITGTSGGEEQQPSLGDVNADKKIDLVDAVYILQHYNQVREFTETQKATADVTKDGTVNLVDALMIMKHFNGEITEF